MIGKVIGAILLTVGMLGTGASDLRAQPAQGDEAQTLVATPARISYIDGQVSFWRPGSAEWTPARVNMPLAPGDSLYTGPNSNVEVQIGPRAFLRAAEETQVGLDNQEPGFVQFRVTAGHASIDLRELGRDQTVELDTPNAAFTIERTGYYVADVTEDTTTFETRRGGRATMTPAGGVAGTVGARQQVVITGTDGQQVQVGPTPEPTRWDRWNNQRTDALVNSPSARYVAPDVYGTAELDRHGSWRTVESYGSVWVPRAVATGWTPYSTGRWIWDPRFGWTWLDDAPWGWAPYHYGRWVHASGVWGWAPGPIVTRPVYAPALVVFLGGGVRLSIGAPLAWAPLAWGEPIIPWWGRPGYIGRPSWDGWGGPRVVNNVVVTNTTIVNVTNITVYRNVSGVSGANAVVSLPADRFGRGDARPGRLSQADVQQLQPVRGELAVKPVAASLAPSSGAAIKPPEKIHARAVVATRPPRDFTPALKAEGLAAPAVVTPPAAPRLVAPPKKEAQAPPVRAVAAPGTQPGTAPGGPPAAGRATPGQPDVKGDKDVKADKDTKGDKAVERPQPPTSPAVATPQPKRDGSPTAVPAAPVAKDDKNAKDDKDVKGDKAAERRQPPPPPTVAPTPPTVAPTPPAVATPQPKREAPPVDASPARPAVKGDKDLKGDKAAERPQPPPPPAMATPQPKRDAAPPDAPARPAVKGDKDVKGDKAAERPQPPPPPTAATPQPKRETPPVDASPARPDVKKDKPAERSQTPPPPTVATPPSAAPRAERPNPRPPAGQPETQGRRPEQPAEPVPATPEPGQPRGARP